jgi:hypothetical protein
MKHAARVSLDRLEQTNQWVTYSRRKRLLGAAGLWVWSGLLIMAAVLVGRHQSAPRSWYVLCAALMLFFTSHFVQLALWPRGALRRAMVVWFVMALFVIPVIALA